MSNTVAYSELVLDDFSGGEVDQYVNDARGRSKYQSNFIVLDNKSLKTRPGYQLDLTGTDSQIPSGSDRISTFFNYLDEKLFVHSEDRVYHRNPTAWAQLVGPTGNSFFSTASEITSQAVWQGHLYAANFAYVKPQKIIKDQAGTYKVFTAGIPGLATSPTVLSSGGAGAENFIYSFFMSHTYMVGSVEFTVFGPISSVALASVNAPSSNLVNITAIPVLANGLTDNYDTSNITIEIYRTQNNGDVLYFVKRVTNGVTSTTDNATDASILASNIVIYNLDGAPESDPPPKARLIHVVNETGYYADYEQGSEILISTIRQSIPGNPEYVPGSFEIKSRDKLKGLSSVNNTPMVLGTNKIYRIEGLFNADGTGSASTVIIHDHAGCVSNNSIVQAENKIYWAGNDGFWASDGYRCVKISDHRNAFYRSMLANTANPENIQGRFDPIERKVLWTVQLSTGSETNDAIYVCDLRWGEGTEMSLYRWEGANFRPSALEVFNDNIYHGDFYGYVCAYSSANKTDIFIDETIAATSFETRAIIYRLETVSTDLNFPLARKWVPKMQVTARNEGNISIGLFAINDDDSIERALVPIRVRNNFVWGSETFVWGSEACVWGGTGLIEQWRRFPKGRIRLTWLQMVVTNSFTILATSDQFGLATVDKGFSTVTLIDADSTWFEKPLNYILTFANDGYEAKFPVVSRVSDKILRVSQNLAALPLNNNYKWELKGYARDEIINLLAIKLQYVPYGGVKKTFESGDTGANL